jgi:propane monooxygenase coupling protein
MKAAPIGLPPDRSPRAQVQLERGIAEALGWDDFGNDELEEIRSCHCGRMVVLDERVVRFANPEDAAEYIGYDLHPAE